MDIGTIIFKLAMLVLILYGIGLYLRIVFRVPPKVKKCCSMDKKTCVICGQKLQLLEHGRQVKGHTVCDACFRLQDGMIGL